MAKAKIGFEVEEHDLAHAKAFVAKHGGSLNKLVSTLFASLGREEARHLPAVDASVAVLVSVSSGKLSVMEAARHLELPDAGHVFHRLSALGLPLPRLTEKFVADQLSEAQSALDECLIAPAVENNRQRKKNKSAARA